MTHRAGGPRHRVPRAWILPATVVVALLGLVAFGFLSTALLMDFVAWWPVWGLLALLAWRAPNRKLGRLNSTALVPLAAILLLGAFLTGHLQGWGVMPSASIGLFGPPVAGFDEAQLTAAIDGELEVMAGSGLLYEVVPTRRGGDVALAEALEEVIETSIAVDLVEPTQASIYEFSGWSVSLNPAAIWNIDLSGRVTADVRGLRLTSLVLSGEGSLVLSRATGPTPVALTGDWVVIVPAGTPVEIVGEALVPGDWVSTDTGWVAPGAGPGWVITVAAGSSVTIETP